MANGSYVNDPNSRFFRTREEAEEKATALELFFDLVYVFAITQIAELFIDELTLLGLAQVTLLLLAIWFSWNYTTWMANWFDPAHNPVRLVLILVMFFNFLMAIAIPHAFDGGASLFILGFLGGHILRSVFNVVAVDPGVRRDGFKRLLFWSLLSAPLWIAGIFAEDETRMLIWTGAVFLDYLAPFVGYWTPGMGSSNTADWDIEPHHFAERFQLLIIIALGETIIVTGGSIVDLGVNGDHMQTLVLGFITTVCMWWLYFDYTAPAAMRRLEESEDVGRHGRDAYTYLHLPIVAGIIAFAVGLKLVIKHPEDVLHGMELAVTVAGPVLYLIGHNLFRYRMVGSISHRRVVGTLALIALAPIGTFVSGQVLLVLITVVMVLLCIWDSIGVRRWYHSQPEHRRPAALKHLEKERTVREQRLSSATSD